MNEHKAKHIDVPGGEGSDWKALHEAFASAFPTPNSLQQVLLALGKNLGNYFGPFTEMPQGIDSIIGDFNAAFHLDDLVNAAIDERPDNGYLRAFALKRGIRTKLDSTNADLVQGGDSLERMLDPVRGFNNPMELINRMSQIVNTVCQINIADRSNGTGFLISNDVVMTNYHVVKRVIENSPGFTPDRIKLKFDFQTPAGGGEATTGTVFSLVEGAGWLVDHSPYDSQDQTVRTRESSLALDRNAEHLDYALLRVDGAPGESVVGDTGVKRGYLKIRDPGPDYAAVFQPESGIFIFQHPKDDDDKILPLQVDWEKPAASAMDNKQLRVVYDVNTTKGSSGSPCFDVKLELIALHHAGGKDWPADEAFLYNQGVPIDKIRDLLKTREVWEKI